MRILFINFNLNSTPGINNGLAILSAVLKEKGHKVGLIFLCDELDYGLDLTRIRGDISDFMPDIVGISLVETQLKHMNVFLKDLKSYYKGLVVCGGPHPTMNPEEVLSIDGIDIACVGEGEDAIVELAETLQSRRGDYRNIRNLWCKSDKGEVIKNKLRPPKNLDELPLEDKELFDLDKLLGLKNNQLEVLLGRGCVFECAYCINRPFVNQYERFCERTVTIKDFVRIKNVKTVIKEIKENILRHPQIEKIAFIDDNFLMYADFAREFFRRYKKEIGLPFMCNANPLSFNAYNGKMLSEAGCDDIRFGVESGSERVKKEIMKRPVPNQSVLMAFNATRELGLMTSSFNMIGLPTESREEVFETLRLNAAIMPDTVKVMTFYPFKNTPLYDLCLRMGLIDEAKKMELDNYDTSTCLKFPAEYQFFLRKIQRVFNWYINAFLENEASPEYAKLIKDTEGMTEKEWNNFDFLARDSRLSENLRKRNVPHYSKFVNRSLAAKSPSKHYGKK